MNEEAETEFGARSPGFNTTILIFNLATQPNIRLPHLIFAPLHFRYAGVHPSALRRRTGMAEGVRPSLEPGAAHQRGMPRTLLAPLPLEELLQLGRSDSARGRPLPDRRRARRRRTSGGTLLRLVYGLGGARLGDVLRVLLVASLQAGDHALGARPPHAQRRLGVAPRRQRCLSAAI